MGNNRILGQVNYAIIDTGASTSIITKSLVEALGLAHLIDGRFQGTAMGVGTGNIIGKIMSVNIKILNKVSSLTENVVDMTIAEGNPTYTISLSVIDDNSSSNKNLFLFGLDQLKRLNGIIYTQYDKLVVTSNNVGNNDIYAFLNHNQLKKANLISWL